LFFFFGLRNISWFYNWNVYYTRTNIHFKLYYLEYSFTSKNIFHIAQYKIDYIFQNIINYDLYNNLRNPQYEKFTDQSIIEHNNKEKNNIILGGFYLLPTDGNSRRNQVDEKEILSIMYLRKGK